MPYSSTISAGMSDLNPSQANGAGEISLSASYVMGGLTVGVTDYQYDDDAANGTDYDGMHYGVSFAVNDDLSVSYDRSISDKSTADTDETINSLQASYTMGSMTVKGHITKADDEGYSAGAESDGSKQLRLVGHFGKYTGVTVVASGATANFTGSNIGDAAAVMFGPSSGTGRGAAAHAAWRRGTCFQTG